MGQHQRVQCSRPRLWFWLGRALGCFVVVCWFDEARMLCCGGIGNKSDHHDTDDATTAREDSVGGGGAINNSRSSHQNSAHHHREEELGGTIKGSTARHATSSRLRHHRSAGRKEEKKERKDHHKKDHHEARQSRLPSSTAVRPIVVEKYKLIFFQIPKVGSTTWKILFRRMMGLPDLEGEAKLIQDPELNGLRFLPEFSDAQQAEMLTSANWTRAVFVRDPMERWLSAYLDKGLKQGFVDKFCCQRNTLCSTAASTTDNDTCLQLIQDCPRRIQESAESAFQVMKVCPDKHWNSQTSLVADILFNFVGHMSTVERDAEALLRRLGAWDEFGAAGWGVSGTERFYQQPRSTELAAAKNVSDDGGQWHATHAHDKLALHMTPTLHAQLLQFYRQDYDNRLFGLTIPPVPDHNINAA